MMMGNCRWPLQGDAQRMGPRQGKTRIKRESPPHFLGHFEGSLAPDPWGSAKLLALKARTPAPNAANGSADIASSRFWTLQ